MEIIPTNIPSHETTLFNSMPVVLNLGENVKFKQTKIGSGDSKKHPATKC